MPIILLAPFNVYAKIINMDPKSSPMLTPEPDQGPASSNGSIIASTPDIATPPTEEQIAAARKARGDMPSGSVVMRANEETSREGRAFLASHPHRSQASGTGDIILRNGPTPGGRKKWVLLGVAAIAVAAIIVVLIGVVGKKGRHEITAAFGEYRKLVIDGPEELPEATETASDTKGEADELPETDGDEEEVSSTEEIDDEGDDQWFVFVESQLLPAGSHAEYIAEVKSSYEKFKEILSSSKKISNENRELIQRNLVPYNELLNCILFITNIEDVENGARTQYQTGGIEAAKSYISQQIPEVEDEFYLASIYQEVTNYLNAQIDLMAFYETRGCLLDGEINASCVSDLYDVEDQEYLNLLDAKELYYENAELRTDDIQALFETQTEEIYEMLGELNG